MSALKRSPQWRGASCVAGQSGPFLCSIHRSVALSRAKPSPAARKSAVVVQAKKDDLRERVGGVIKAGDTFAEGATDVVGGNLPRPLIKAGISLALVAFGWSLLKKAVSTAIFFGVAGSVLTFVLKSQFSSKK